MPHFKHRVYTMKERPARTEGDMNDERIARLADALIGAEQRTSVLEGPVRINDRFFAFVRTPLFDGRLLVCLPEDFTDMSEEESRIKYPSSNRPKIIKADERGAACFTFDTVDSPLDEKYESTSEEYASD
jgi:hypothetical protein